MCKRQEVQLVRNNDDRSFPLQQTEMQNAVFKYVRSSRQIQRWEGIILHTFKPKFHYADFHRNFPAGKVMDTNHESRGPKRWQIMKPWSFGESHRHKSRKSRTKTISTCRDVCDKVRDKSATNPCVSLWWNLVRYNARGTSATKSATKSSTSSRQSRGLVMDINHESRRRDLCRGLSWFVSATLSQTCPGLCCEVSVMEFGLYHTYSIHNSADNSFEASFSSLPQRFPAIVFYSTRTRLKSLKIPCMSIF